MAVDQLPDEVREFAGYLDGLMRRLDQEGGWCGVFWQRDPDGMRACLDGWEVPPWDVVEALLQDLAAEYGGDAVAREALLARSLHRASLAAFDTRPGARDALGDRLDVMLREQRYAAERQTELNRLLGETGTAREAETVRLDLAWARDDHERATARCAEIRHRMENLDRRALHTRAPSAPGCPGGVAGDVLADVWSAAGDHAGEASAEPVTPTVAEAARVPGPTGSSGSASPGNPGFHGDASASANPRPGVEPTDPTDAHASAGPGTLADGSMPDAYDPAAPWREGPAVPPRDDLAAPSRDGSVDAQPADAGVVRAPAPEPATVPRQRSRRRPRGSARFAGMPEAATAPAPAPGASVPLPATPAAPSRRTPRGARFAGAAEERPQPATEPLDGDAGRATAETVETLVALRAEGRSGEAHATLVEAANWPAARFPLLASELHRAGLDADWATLLWEAASLPADRLVAASDALAAAGRTADGEQMLRQGVARPAPEIGTAVLGLAGQGRRREIRALLDAYVRVRTPEEAARSAQPDPERLVPLLLDAARGVSQERHWDLVHALRVAGFTT